MMGASDLSESIKAEAELQKENPYVQAYIRERGRVADEDSILNNSEQRATDIETLKGFYEDDIKVAKIIQKYQTATKSINMVEKITSLNKENISELLDRVVDIYDMATEEEQELLLSYMLRYNTNCGNEQTTKFFESLNNSQPIQLAANYSYNINNAVNYALKWDGAGLYNTAQYPNMDGAWSDCTNFVSQCMYAGGVPMDYSWFCYKRNNSYPKPTTTWQLNHSWNLKDPSPWTAIRTFTSYWFPKTTVRQYSRSYYINNFGLVFNAVSRGDVLVFTSGAFGVLTWGVHAMFVVGYNASRRDLLVSGHSNNREAVSLRDLIVYTDYAGLDFYQF